MIAPFSARNFCLSSRVFFLNCELLTSGSVNIRISGAKSAGSSSLSTFSFLARLAGTWDPQKHCSQKQFGITKKIKNTKPETLPRCRSSFNFASVRRLLRFSSIVPVGVCFLVTPPGRFSTKYGLKKTA